MAKTFFDAALSGDISAYGDMSSYAKLIRESDGSFQNFIKGLKKLREDKHFVVDTTGSDYFFMIGFITKDMEFDFDCIEKDFLDHRFNKLEEFGRIQKYDNNYTNLFDPDRFHKTLVLESILNGVRCGDEYCKALLQYLFKTYHKPLYKQLKRFSRISEDEIVDLSRASDEDDEGEYIDAITMSIILTMCLVNNITLCHNCFLTFDFLNSNYNNIELKLDECFAKKDFLFIEECRKQVEEWIEEDINNNPNPGKQKKIHKKDLKFVKACLTHKGYSSDYLEECVGYELDATVQYTNTLVVLKTMYPNKTFTFDDVQHYAALYNSITGLTTMGESYIYRSKLYLRSDDDIELGDNQTLFKPENIIVSTSNKKKDEKDKTEKEEKVMSNIASVENTEGSKEDYLAEINALQEKLKASEMQNRNLKAQYAEARDARKEAEAMLSGYEKDRNELIALRNFVYNLKNEDEDKNTTDISIKDMKAAIADKAYVVIGGHTNWINKLKDDFPNWTYIMTGANTTIDVRSLMNKDKIFFFSDHISHTTYGKCKDIAMEKKIPFSYLHGVNIEQNIKQIYREQEEK